MCHGNLASFSFVSEWPDVFYRNLKSECGIIKQKNKSHLRGEYLHFNLAISKKLRIDNAQEYSPAAKRLWRISHTQLVSGQFPRDIVEQEAIF